MIQNTNKTNGCTSFFTWYFRLLDVFSNDKCLFLKHDIVTTSLQIFWLIFMDKSWETTFHKKSYTIVQNNQDKPQHTIKCPKKSYKKLQTRLTFKIQGNGHLTWENSKNLNCHMILSSFELHCFALALKFTRFWSFFLILIFLEMLFEAMSRLNWQRAEQLTFLFITSLTHFLRYNSVRTTNFSLLTSLSSCL